MRTIANAEKNKTAGMIPWQVLRVNALPEYRLLVQFADGTEGIVDMAQFLKKDCGVFIALRDVAAFNSAHVAGGAVTWENELDLAPDRMYDKLNEADVYVMA